MATGVERLKTEETEGKTDSDTLLSETDGLHIDINSKDIDVSELGITESKDSGIVLSNASSGVQSVDVTNLESSVENVNLTDKTISNSADADNIINDLTGHEPYKDGNEEFFEARLDSNPEPLENVITENDMIPELSDTNIGRDISETTTATKVVDLVSEAERYSSTSEGSAEENDLYESSQRATAETTDNTSHGNDFHGNSDRTANEQARNSASQEETVNEVHNGHIRGSVEAKDGNESSDTEGEYESADEGEEIQVDADQLKNLEESLTEEQKEEQRNFAQVLKEEGNELFRCGSYKSAIKIYSRALRTCPLKFAKDRAIMYSNRAVCKMKLTDHESAIRDCSKALDLHPHYMKALMRRAELYEKTEKLDEALTDYQKILELDPSQHSARAACMRLPEQIKERNEKLKAEMMDKLKDLGNLILRPFGLSTNNFQMNQDPNTGGYSVNFVQNPGQ